MPGYASLPGGATLYYTDEGRGEPLLFRACLDRRFGQTIFRSSPISARNIALSHRIFVAMADRQS